MGLAENQEYWEALVEWQGGGLEYVTTENLVKLKEAPEEELNKRNHGI